MFGVKGKKYKNVVILENEKDAMLIATKEGYGNVNTDLNGIYPVVMTMNRPRKFVTAVKKAIEYSKMGIFNLISKQ